MKLSGDVSQNRQKSVMHQFFFRTVQVLSQAELVSTFCSILGDDQFVLLLHQTVQMVKIKIKVLSYFFMSVGLSSLRAIKMRACKFGRVRRLFWD